MSPESAWLRGSKVFQDHKASFSAPVSQRAATTDHAGEPATAEPPPRRHLLAACDRQLEAERLFRLKQLNKTAQIQLNHSSEERGERSWATRASVTVCREESDSITACFHLWIGARHRHINADFVHVAILPVSFKPPKVAFFHQTSLFCPPTLSVFFHLGL